MKVTKFDPRNNFGPDILGETGCANCGHLIDLFNLPCLKGWQHIDNVGGQSNCRVEDCGCKNPQPKKAQTIRDKPVKVGEELALWEMWRGMKKGYYCTKCFVFWRIESGVELSEGIPTCTISYECACDAQRVNFPRKLLNVTVKEVVPIKMRFDGSFLYVIDGKYMCMAESLSDGAESFGIPYGNSQHSFVKADTPNWDNRTFIDFFLKHKPEIKKKWVRFWIWKW